MKFSFDFDGTLLDSKFLQSYCQQMLQSNIDVYIITRRLDLKEGEKFGINEAKEVYELAKILGIKKENIYFTNRAYKYDTVKKLDIDCHIDDDYIDVSNIRTLSKSKCIHFIENEEWEKEIKIFW